MCAMTDHATATVTALQPPASTQLLRTREPRGVIDAAEATRRLRRLAGSSLTAVETSMGRLVAALATDPVHLLVLGAPMSMSTAPATGAALAEPSSPEAVAALARWIGRTVTDVRVEDIGTLVVQCGSESVRVAADPSYEAWEVRGMDGGLLACLPGGGISLWTPTVGAIPHSR